MFNRKLTQLIICRLEFSPTTHNRSLLGTNITNISEEYVVQLRLVYVYFLTKVFLCLFCAFLNISETVKVLMF